MMPTIIQLCQDVKQKRLNIIVERLVIEKHFSKETQVLAINLVLAPVHFKDGQMAIPVDFVAGRMPEMAFELREYD